MEENTISTACYLFLNRIVSTRQRFWSNSSQWSNPAVPHLSDPTDPRGPPVGDRWSKRSLMPKPVNHPGGGDGEAGGQANTEETGHPPPHGSTPRPHAQQLVLSREGLKRVLPATGPHPRQARLPESPVRPSDAAEAAVDRPRGTGSPGEGRG